ncbi:MAG: hypothetical protein K0R80_2789 [Clostridia bacterium]|nr:hypothetical protein [Clostridia bacterium]
MNGENKMIIFIGGENISEFKYTNKLIQEKSP